MGILDRFRRRESDPEILPALAAATRVRCRAPLADTILFETSERDELAALAAALRVEPKPGGYCMCFGTLVFELSNGAITLHHGVSVRWEGAGGNHMLRSPDAIMDWLSARGMTFVREEYEEDRRRGEESDEQARRWTAAMPASLVPFFEEMRRSGGDQRPEWTAALEAELPDPLERASILLDLFGSGVGPWSGYPSWESVPEQVLLDMPLDVLIRAIGDAPDARRCEGAARLFSSFSFRKQRTSLRAKLPDELRRLLLAHVERSGDDGKRTSARRTLGE